MRITTFLLSFTLFSVSSAFFISPHLADFLPEFLKPVVVDDKAVPSAPESSEEVVVAAEIPNSIMSTGEVQLKVLSPEAEPLNEENSAHGSLNDVMNSAKFDLKKIIEERRAQILERKAALKGNLPVPIPMPASAEQSLNDVASSAASKFDLKKIIEERRAQILERKAALKGILPIPISKPASTDFINDVMSSAKFDLKKIIEERRAQILERKAVLRGVQPVPIPNPASTEQSLDDVGTASAGAVVDFKKLIEERRAEILKRINAQKAVEQSLDDAIPSARLGLKEIIDKRRAEILKIKTAQQSLVQSEQNIERTMPLRPLKNKLSPPHINTI